MLALRKILGFDILARVLVLALGLGLGLGAPIGADQYIACAVAVDCAVSPAEEPRERENLSLSVAGSSHEKPQRVTAAALEIAPARQPLPAIIASPFGESEFRPSRDRGDLPDKTGPPAA
jgi:hypothetical protein